MLAPLAEFPGLGAAAPAPDDSKALTRIANLLQRIHEDLALEGAVYPRSVSQMQMVAPVAAGGRLRGELVWQNSGDRVVSVRVRRADNTPYVLAFELNPIPGPGAAALAPGEGNEITGKLAPGQTLYVGYIGQTAAFPPVAPYPLLSLAVFDPLGLPQSRR